MKLLKKTFIFWLGCFLCLLILFSLNAFHFTTKEELLKDLCDGFSITGFLFIAISLLIWISNFGMFYMISYGFKRMFGKLEGVSFYDYKNQISKHPSWKKLFKVGSIFFLVGIVFLVLFYVI